MKTKIFIALTVMMLSLNGYASVTCPGKVTQILDWPAKCEGKIAFRLDTSGNTWWCTLSEISESMVLTAYAAGKRIKPRIQSNTPDCQSVENHHEPVYIYLLD